MTDATLIHPRRRSFATSDPATARTFVDEVYGGAVLRLRESPGEDWRATLSEITAGGISVCDLRIPGRLAFDVGRGKQVVVETVLSGSAEITHGRRTSTYARGDVFVGIRPDARLPSRTDDLHVHTITLPVSLLLELASELPGRPRSLRRLLASAADPSRARRWRELIRFVDGLLADEEIAVAPLVLGPTERLLAATVLSFARDEGSPPAEDARDAHPEALRRAIAFIEANPDRDVTLADIAGAAYVSPRAVQLAFRRHLDTTPIAYLRQVRLDQAHAHLRAAIAGDGTTVTGVALEWGFANPGRFARLYRAAYGIAPSDTLRG
jgi:AraC-like DNA-binding protein